MPPMIDANEKLAFLISTVTEQSIKKWKAVFQEFCLYQCYCVVINSASRTIEISAALLLYIPFTLRMRIVDNDICL